MRISAKADYAVRATLELAASPERAPVKGTKLAAAQEIPLQFLEQIMLEELQRDLLRGGQLRPLDRRPVRARGELERSSHGVVGFR